MRWHIAVCKSYNWQLAGKTATAAAAEAATSFETFSKDLI